ncbi:MAG: hypothetical protein EOM87_01355, partial [Clostridia bacterium]|nr:hypothetical protein [Clostridia bacterium]
MITAITKNLKTKKYDIFFNGEMVGSLSDGALLLSRLVIGKEIEKEMLMSIMSKGECRDALSDLLSVLG